MLLPGDKIGPYTICERAGQGGMAIVYQAWHEGLHRLEALKVPRGAGQNASDSAYIQRLLAEARVAAGLHHPNIVAIHGVSEPLAPIPFFAMDWVQGRDLAQILAQKRRFSLEETTQILEQVASALDYAHGRGVVHRDIKPANILLSEENGASVPKVVDFGISRAAEDDDLSGETKLTRSGMIVGTPEYMSPEQAGSGEKVDFRTDIYSLGVVAYEMLCGAPPFTAGSGVSRLSILISHVRDVAPLWQKFPDFPSQSGAAILSALSKMPAERPASCAAFVAALRATSEENHAFFAIQQSESEREERTPFDESRFERDEAATIFERPISLSDTPPPGPPPTLLPAPKISETAIETPRQSPTSSNFSPRARALEAAAQNAVPASPPVLAASSPIQTEKESANASAAPVPASPDQARAIPGLVSPSNANVPRAASRTVLWAGISGILMGGALVLVLLGRGSSSSTHSPSPAPSSVAGLESAVALPLQTGPKTGLENSKLQTRPSAPVSVPPAAAPPRLRFVKVVRTSDVPFQTITRRSSRRARGSRFVAQRGRTGARQTTLQISYRGAQELARRALAQRVTRQPQPEIVVLGTRASAPLVSAASPRVRVSRIASKPAFRVAPRVMRARTTPRKAAAVKKPRSAVVKRRMVREAPLPP